jgi:hypothetical protein
MKERQTAQHQADPALAGPIIPGQTLATFDDVVGRAIQDEPRSSRVPVSWLRPRLACVPDLLDQVAEVLRGNPIAAEGLRQTLGSFGGAAVPTPAARAILEGDVLKMPSKREPGNEKSKVERAPAQTLTHRTRWDRLLTPHRLEPLAAAAVYVSRDAKELATMLGGIQLGLAGIDEMQTLFELALSGTTGPSLVSAFETARRVILPMESWSGEPALPDGSAKFPFEPPGVPGGFGFPGFPVPGFGWPLPGGGKRPDPEAGPIPFEPPRGLLLTEFFERCFLMEIVPKLHRRGIGFREFVTGSSGHYVINSVEPANACPGDLITIRGSNFSGTTAVHFINDRGRTVSAEPVSAADDRVTVRLPEEARTGPVSLYIPIQIQLCLTTPTMARPGRPGDIRVGRASILRFEIRHALGCVAMGDTTALLWRVLPDDANVRITRRLDSRDTVLDPDAGAIGELALDTSMPGSYEFRIDVSNPSGSCGGASRTISLEVMPSRPASIQIVGVEITQAIQVFSLADPPPEPNNSIGLIADMDTVLRVFVRTSYPATDYLARVTGALRFRGNTYLPINEPSPFINAPRTPNRELTNDSLNFLIPAADASGSDDVSVEVFTTESCADARETWREVLTWANRPALPVTIRRIADSGPTPNVFTEAEALDIVIEAFSRIPSPKTAITMHPGVHQIRAGTTEDNYCTDGGFYELALSIAYEHNDNEGVEHQSSWVGIYWRPCADCDVRGMMAWPSTSTCISCRGPEIVAHELMHTVGLGHTKTSAGEDCENVAQPVACHWLDLMDGVLDQVVFDIPNNGVVVRANDLQSYKGSPRWLSDTLWVLGRNLMDTRY